MSGFTNPPPNFPPSGPVTLQNTIRSYPYAQYTDDDTIQQFVAAYNYLAQQWLNDFNALNLPFYPTLSGDLLDWVAGGLYGLTRPILGIPRHRPSGAGPYNTVEHNAIAYGTAQLSAGTAPAYHYMTDDEFQRLITWHVYKGDGFQFTTGWLKRRVHRFLNGANGYMPAIDNTYDVSVFSVGFDITIEVPYSPISTTLTLAIADNRLALPYQYTYTITTPVKVFIFPVFGVSAAPSATYSPPGGASPEAAVGAQMTMIMRTPQQTLAPEATVFTNAQVM